MGSCAFCWAAVAVIAAAGWVQTQVATARLLQQVEDVMVRRRGDVRQVMSDPRWRARRRIRQEFEERTGLGLELPRRECPTMVDHMSNLAMLVVPRLRLAFCYMPKAACTNFKDLFNALNGLDQQPGFVETDSYVASMPQTLNFPVENVTKANGWTFATFTRDPLERYAAVYGCACVPRTDGSFQHYSECCGAYADVSSPEATRRSFERRVFSDVENGLVFEDQHWNMQVQTLHNCGWERFAPELLDYRGDLSSGNVSGQVHELLAMVKATSEDHWRAAVIFQEGKRGYHRNPISSNYRSLYARREVIDAVKTLYKADFALMPGIGRAFTDKLEPKA